MNSNFSGAYFVSDKFYSNSILVYICDYLGNRNCLVASVYAEEIRKNPHPPPPHTHTQLNRTQWYINAYTLMLVTKYYFFFYKIVKNKLVIVNWYLNIDQISNSNCFERPTCIYVMKKKVFHGLL